MPTLNLEYKDSKDSKINNILPKEIKKLIKDYEECKWLTGC
jgi:hypothetical protein